MTAVNTWFRFYHEALDDPKVQRLSPTLFKTWVNLLCVACQTGGLLPSVDDCAFKLRISIQDAEQQLSELVSAGLVDLSCNGMKRTMHGWMKRQFLSDCSSERVRKHRKNKEKFRRNGDETLHGTAPEQNRAESEQSRSPQSPPPGAADDGACGGPADQVDATPPELAAEPPVPAPPADAPRPVAAVEAPTARREATPVADLRRLFARPDADGGFAIHPGTGALSLDDRQRAFWVDQFGGDGRALDLALIEVSGRLQPHSSRPLAAQAGSQLARIAADKHGRDQRYRDAAARNARGGPPAAGGAIGGRPTLAEVIRRRREGVPA